MSIPLRPKGTPRIPLVDRLQKLYDPKEFIYSSADEHGHSSNVRFRLHPHTAQAVDIIVAEQKFPYRTKKDLFRHAIELLIQLLHQMEPSAPGKKAWSASQRILKLRETVAQATRDAEELIPTLKDMLQQGDAGFVRSFVQGLRQDMEDDEMPHVYSSRLLAVLRHEFRYDVSGVLDDLQKPKVAKAESKPKPDPRPLRAVPLNSFAKDGEDEDGDFEGDAEEG